MVTFYMDEQVPSAITKGLRDRSVDALTAQEDGREGDGDPMLLDRATQLRRVVVTIDRDFFALTAARQAAGQPFVGVMIAPETLSFRQRIDDLEMIAKCSELEEWASKLTVLPLTR
jgi:predicted nuclease of predicted toxin-antitoxin system